MAVINNFSEKKNMFSGIPSQRLTAAEKVRDYGSVEEWAEAVIDGILSISVAGYGNGLSYLADKQKNIDLYNDLFDPADIANVCNPLGLDTATYGFPATMAHYNIITPKIKLLEGEEIKRPFNYRVVAVNPGVISSVEKEKKEAILGLLQAELARGLQARGVDAEVPEQQFGDMEALNKYFTYSYTDIREKLGNDSLKYLVRHSDAQFHFQKGWKDLLVTGEEIFWTGIINGEPRFRRVDPRSFQCSISPDSDYVDESEWAYEERYLTPAEIFDEFFTELGEEDAKTIEEMSGSSNALTIRNSAFGSSVTYLANQADGKESYVGNGNLIRVIRVEWRSTRKLGFVTFFDENGQLVEDMVDETHKKKDGETIEWKWVSEVWEGTLIGSDIYVGIRPKPNQYKSLDDPNATRLGYTGVYYATSMVGLLKSIQYLYDIIMYRLELTVATSGGKATLMDLAQLPRQHGFDIEKWLYYLRAFNVQFVNSFEEGTGRFKDQRAQFNQFQAIDMTMGRVVDQYVLLLDKLERMAGEITGISRQRQGQIVTQELVGNTERAVVQSSHITEPLFFAHNEVKKRVLTALLENAKLAWIDGKKAQYVLDDMSRMLLNVEGPELAEAEFGIFVSNSTKDELTLQTARQAITLAVQSGNAQVSDLITAMETESVSEIKNKLKTSELERAERDQANAKASEEAASQRHAEEMDLEMAKLELEKENNIRDNEVRLAVAAAGAVSQESKDENDRAKVNTQASSAAADQSARNRDLELKSSALDVAREKMQRDSAAKDKALEIKRKQAADKGKSPKK